MCTKPLLHELDDVLGNLGGHRGSSVPLMSQVAGDWQSTTLVVSRVHRGDRDPNRLLKPTLDIVE